MVYASEEDAEGRPDYNPDGDDDDDNKSEVSRIHKTFSAHLQLVNYGFFTRLARALSTVESRLLKIQLDQRDFSLRFKQPRLFQSSPFRPGRRR